MKLKFLKPGKSKGRKKVGVAPEPAPEACLMCDICEMSLQQDGLVVCIDGQPALANDYPTTGGPWAPVFQGGSGPGWFNVGGL